MENQLLWGLWIALGVYLLWKAFSGKKETDYDAEMHDVLTNDAYKVKGRYDNE